MASSFSIDKQAYDKADRYPINHGYGLRVSPPSSLVIHSTNNSKKNTFFTAEAKFLYESDDVSAHFLVGKDGKIVQFLDPRIYEAWHAGRAKAAWGNEKSIGIELHHSVGDGAYPTAQIVALTRLVRALMELFHIPAVMVETHRAVALPAKRKTDPNDWSNTAFYAWRETLDDAPPPPRPPALYRALAPMWISETPTAKGPIALDGKAIVFAGETVVIDEVRSDGFAHLQNGVGFVGIGGLARLATREEPS